MRTTIHLLGEDWKHALWINPAERLSMLAEGIAERVYRNPDGSLTTDNTGQTDGTIKLCTHAPAESNDGFGYGAESPTGLTRGDMFRNAAGAVDTLKWRQVAKIRLKQEPDEKPFPAALRAYGRGVDKKPDADLVGNGVDRSMSRVEQWPHASEHNRSVTVVPGGVVGLREVSPKELEAMPAFAL